MRAMIVKGIRQGMNGLLYGPPGVGKTQILRDAVAELGLTLKYFSAPTLDPWADLVGIPVPVTVQTACGPRSRLTFVRPADVEEAEVIIVDELNRGHPRTQNAVLEMVQFRTINGTPLPRLRAVFAAINPSDGGRHVHELDPAMIDRFDLHFDVRPEPDASYFVERRNLRPDVAAAL
ncbi:MAG: AAA family ATPase, partial [Phycisphaerae bacterium]|nr:AAA family ATPase [Phycisphaerae bacterium]